MNQLKYCILESLNEEDRVLALIFKKTKNFKLNK